ncbi:hypothetical protein NMG60_11033459 [Bertholletia excelsa]
MNERKIVSMNSLCLWVFLLLVVLGTKGEAKVRVEVMNRLGGGRRLSIHCRSGDDDLGYHSLEEEREMAWSFSPNIWATTLFYCEVRWDGCGSDWKSFDAYDEQRDYWRCSSRCLWMINKEGSLYGYDEEDRYWQWFPFSEYSSSQHHLPPN